MEKLWMKDENGAPTIPVVAYAVAEGLEMRIRDQESELRRLRIQVRERGEADQSWIPVTERLPELSPMYLDGPMKSDYVLVATDRWNSVMYARIEETYKRRQRKWKAAHCEIIGVTHWMPLPKLPERATSKREGT